jgi:hypothetical protein
MDAKSVQSKIDQRIAFDRSQRFAKLIATQSHRKTRPHARRVVQKMITLGRLS